LATRQQRPCGHACCSRLGHRRRKRRASGGALAIRIDGRTGELLWYDQVTPHDVRDYDFQATPILATVGDADLVIGAGKAGRVIAWDRATRRRRWATEVGLHRNDAHCRAAV